MYFDMEPGPVFRPPSEANSFILRITVGCSHNKCTYCDMYRTVQFHIKSKEDVFEQIRVAASTGIPVRRVFLADGDALILSTPRLLEILKELKRVFPQMQRVSAYAGPKAILSKTKEELAELNANGLKLLYYGMETGDDQTLHDVNKGVNAKEALEAGVHVKSAGMKLSMMVILGLAGKPGSFRHAEATGKAVSIIKPDMLSALTLMLYRGSELKELYEKGEFEILSPPELMQELYHIVDNIDLPLDCRTIFRSNHISNYVSIAGVLPKDKEKMLRDIKQAKEKLDKMSFYDPYNDVESY